MIRVVPTRSKTAFLARLRAVTKRHGLRWKVETHGGIRCEGHCPVSMLAQTTRCAQLKGARILGMRQRTANQIADAADIPHTSNPAVRNLRRALLRACDISEPQGV